MSVRQMRGIRPAKPSEAEEISALALRSKSHWGYNEDQLSVFRDELTLEPQDIVPRRTHVVEEAGRLLGFYTLTPQSRSKVELEHLFVEPSELHRGFGAALFRHACRVAREEGYVVLAIQSDPNAAEFYDRLGANRLREIPSSIPGRSIPYYEFSLEGP